MSFPPIEEVRSGLFLMRFTQNVIAIGHHGFQPRKCDYYSFTLVIDEVSEEAHAISIIKHLSNKIKTLPIGSKLADVSRISQLGKNEDDLPQFVWILLEGESKPLHLQFQGFSNDLCNTKKTWGPLNILTGKNFDLWLDFGTDTQGERKALNQWATLLTQQDDTDVEFNVKGELMGAHAPVIMASCPTFASIIRRTGRSTNKSTNKVVHINDIEPPVFQQLLHYIYTGRAPLIQEEGMTEQLFSAAKKYGLDHLKDECARCLLADLAEHNVVDTLIWSHKNSLTNLHDGALNFAAVNYPKVSLQSDWQILTEKHPQISLRVSLLLKNQTNRGI